MIRTFVIKLDINPNLRTEASIREVHRKIWGRTLISFEEVKPEDEKWIKLEKG